MYTIKIFKDYPWLIFISGALFEIDGFLDADGGAGFKNGTAEKNVSKCRLKPNGLCY